MIRQEGIGVPPGISEIPTKEKERKFNKKLIRMLFAAEFDEPGRTQNDFAKYVGKHAVTVNRSLRGRGKATKDIANALVRWFSEYGLPREAFFLDSDFDITITLSGHDCIVN